MLVHQSLVNLRFVFLLVLFYLSVVDTGVLFVGVYSFCLCFVVVVCWGVVCCFVYVFDASVFIIRFLLITIVIRPDKFTNNA